MQKIKVMQDGADFYRVEGEDLNPIFHAPQAVKDGDMEAAENARRTFLAYAKEYGFEPVFEVD